MSARRVTACSSSRMSGGSIPISRAMPTASMSPPPGTPFVELPLPQVKSYDVGQIRPDSAYARQFPEQRAVAGHAAFRP